jgi:hypothetical protein
VTSSPEAIEVLALSVVLLVAVVLVSLHYLRQYRTQRLRKLREESAGPGPAEDRAFNRLALARREADLLAAQGGNVEPARQLIDLSGRSFDRHEYDRAYELAQSAHETLVKARREPMRSRPPAPAPGVGGTPAAGATASLPRTGSLPASTTAVPAAGPAVPQSRAEAHFQLRLFEDELAAAAGRPANAAEMVEARGLYVEAHAAFSRNEYLEAFRIALRGRRRLGAHIESLGPPAVTPSGCAPLPVPSAGDAERSAEEVAGQERCPSCGHPTLAGDTFCRGCGTARTPTVCPTCGASRKPTDSFCGRCGERYGVVGA